MRNMRLIVLQFRIRATLSVAMNSSMNSIDITY